MKNVIEWYWEDENTLVCITKDKEEYRLINPYWSSLKFDGLDYSDNEIVEIELTKKYL